MRTSATLESTSFRVLTMVMLLFRLLYVAIAAELITAWDWDNGSQPISIYRSRPDLLAPILTPLESIHNRDKMAPGYYFVAPYANMQPALYIYDNNADLVYTSFGSAGTAPIHAPHMCTYHGAPHLCFYQGVQHVGWGHGHGVIMNQNYRVVKSVEPSCSYQASSDMHEFQVIDNGRQAVMTQYVRNVYDLCPWGLCDGLGFIQSGDFQIVDVDSGECIFHWSSINHVKPDDSLVPPSSTEISGSGEGPEMPWDYFHINSIDRSNFDGGYLISARHVSAIYKIDGKTGEIVWQLGGKKNEYEYDNELGEIDFGFQHDARWISDSADESVITFYDNASNGYTETARYSTGKIVRLNHKTKVARLVEKPLSPPFVDGHAHLSKSQGNFQLNLPGYQQVDIGGDQTGKSPGNRLMGFGNDPFFAEYTWNTNEESGIGEWEAVFYGALAWTNMMNYRVLKFDGWEGVPQTKPALWAFSQFGMNHTTGNENPMVLYTSWNGHTKIDTFMFYGANTAHARSDINSPDWDVLMAGWKKNGFETIYRHPQTYKYIYVAAFDANSISLGRSEVVETFTPSGLMREYYCDELACTWMDTNNPDRENMRQKMRAVYNEWALANQNETREDLDGFYSDRTNHGQEGRNGGRFAIFIISFVVLGMVIVGLGFVVGKRFNRVQKLLDGVVVALGLRVRRHDQSRKGLYQGLQHDDMDSEDVESDNRSGLGSMGSGMRGYDNELRGGRGSQALEAERQSFWRGESP